MNALLIIDIQKGLTKKPLYCKELFLGTVNQAIKKFRENNELIIFIQHENKQLTKGSSDWEIDSTLLINERDSVFSKTKGDAFSNQNFVNCLLSNNISNILVAGLVTHGCVIYTCRGGKEKGFSISLLKNGHSCWNKDAKEKISKTESALTDMGIETLDISEI